MTEEGYDHLFKLLLVGDSGVGKSSLMFRFSDNAFHARFIWPMRIFDFKLRTVEAEGKRVKLQIWHARRRERFHTSTSSLASRYRGTVGIMVLYDVTKRKTFDHVTKWLRNIDEHAGADVERMILANKSDMSDARVVSKEEGENLALQHNVNFYEVSAKENICVEEAFLKMTQDILKRREVGL